MSILFILNNNVYNKNLDLSQKIHQIFIAELKVIVIYKEEGRDIFSNKTWMHYKYTLTGMQIKVGH